VSDSLDRFTLNAPPENTGRGTIMALVIVPVGVMAWLLLWNFGFIASIVAFGIAAGAHTLYRWGSGGRVGWGGAVRILLITVATLALAFLTGLLSDFLPVWMELTSASVPESLVDPQFWEIFASSAADPRNGVLISLLAGIGLGALGCFWVLRSVFVEARAQSTLDVMLPHPDDDVTDQPVAG
jgi:hypothetical protein